MSLRATIGSPWTLLAACSCAYLGSLAVSGARLPDRVASHFGFGGLPDGWMSRPMYLLVMAATGLGLSGMFLSIAWLVRRMPADFVNIPNRHYWLSAERRAATSVELERRFVWFAALALAFLLTINVLVVDANQRDPVRLSNAIWTWLAIFLLTTFAWLASLVRHFSSLPTSEA